MENKITPITWYADVKEHFSGQAIDDDFMLFDDFSLVPNFNYPFKLDMTTCLIFTKGRVRGKINMKSYEINNSPCILVTFPEQILEHEYFSDDFEGYAFLLSKRFLDTFVPSLKERGSIFLQLSKNPCLALDKNSLSFLNAHCEIMKSVFPNQDNLPHRAEIVRYQMLSIFYYLCDRSNLVPFRNQQNKPFGQKEEFVTKFIDLLENNYKTQRQVGFYADNLNITPKYLSQIIKTATGKSVNDWIEEYVVLEAKALLKSTKMTIQQISDELNFPSQSFFGKYFKRLEGVSPKVYRES
jgi:AraC-type DNA-binding domain-containing proteins